MRYRRYKNGGRRHRRNAAVFALPASRCRCSASPRRDRSYRDHPGWADRGISRRRSNHRPGPVRRCRQGNPQRSRLPGRYRRARRGALFGVGRHAVRVQCRRAAARGLSADLAYGGRDGGHRPRGSFRLRRLGDRAHRRCRRPDGAAPRRHERRPARRRRPRPSRRRFRERGLETLLRGSSRPKPAHRPPAPRSALARRHRPDPDA